MPLSKSCSERCENFQSSSGTTKVSNDANNRRIRIFGDDRLRRVMFLCGVSDEPCPNEAKETFVRIRFGRTLYEIFSLDTPQQ